MALSTQEQHDLNQMCPAAKKATLGDKVAGSQMANLVITSGAVVPSAVNIGNLFFDTVGKNLFIVVDASTKKQVTLV